MLVQLTMVSAHLLIDLSEFNDLQSFNLSTALMAVHKDSFTPHNLTQQGGLNRRET